MISDSIEQLRVLRVLRGSTGEFRIIGPADLDGLGRLASIDGDTAVLKVIRNEWRWSPTRSL